MATRAVQAFAIDRAFWRRRRGRELTVWQTTFLWWCTHTSRRTRRRQPQLFSESCCLLTQKFAALTDLCRGGNITRLDYNRTQLGSSLDMSMSQHVQYYISTHWEHFFNDIAMFYLRLRRLVRSRNRRTFWTQLNQCTNSSLWSMDAAIFVTTIALCPAQYTEKVLGLR